MDKSRDESKDSVVALGAGAIGSGAAVTAAIAAACCVGPALGPVFLWLLGASGLVAIVGLRPYSPLLLLGSGVLIALSARRIYFRNAACAVCDARPSVSTSAIIARGLLAFSALLWTAALVYAVYGFLHE